MGSVYVPCEVDYLLSTKDVNLLSSIKHSKETFSNIKVTGPAVEDIEALYASGINNYSDLMKFMNNKQVGNSFIQNVVTEYGSKVQKCLKNKKLCTIVELHETRIIYSYDDDCCYFWSEEENDAIYKISISQVLQASKQSYQDLLKIYKEYDKK